MHQIAMGSSERRAPSPASGTAVARGNSGSNQEGSNSVPARTSASAIQEAQENEKEMLKRVQELTAKVDQIEKQVHEVNRLRIANQKNRLQPSNKLSLPTADQDKENGGGSKKHETFRREAASSKRMAELARQFGSLLRQIMQHKWSWPFLDPVDVEGLGLTDYFEIVKKPMDLGTIRNRMDAKDGKGYNNLYEICDDVRLVFSNAMTYNEQGTDVHKMAKTLAAKFEEKWKLLEAKIVEEEVKRKQEESEASVAAVQIGEETATNNLADELSRELEELDKQLEDLKQQAGPKCRTMTVKEKRQLGHFLGKLSSENLNRVIHIIAQKNPGFDAASDEVVVDIDTLDPATLWRLHRFVLTVNAAKTRACPLKHTTSTKRVGGQGKGGPRKQRKTTSS